MKAGFTLTSRTVYGPHSATIQEHLGKAGEHPSHAITGGVRLESAAAQKQ